MDSAKRTIAVAANDTLGLKGWVSPHFGHCRSWVLVEVEDGKIVSSRVIANPYEREHHCNNVSDFLAELGAKVVIAGGLGRSAHGHLLEHGIEAVTGYTGKVQDSVEAWLRGESPDDAICDHHGERRRN